MRNKVIVSQDAGEELKNYLSERADLIIFRPISTVAEPVRCHPDLVYCRLKEDIIFMGNERLLKPVYPGDIIYNGFSTGKYFIHDLEHTDRSLLKSAKDLNLTLVNVKQGYACCSIVPVDEDSIITYDRGIAKAAEAAGLSVLTIGPGHVELPGYDTGFIGGTSGRVGDEIIFNGDLSAHPDCQAIRQFIEERGLKVRYFSGYPLRDIGSII
jgi:hypothetical protein